MDILKAASDNNTKLYDRTLWYDGDSTILATDIVQNISSGISVQGLFVDNISKDITQYNSLVKPADKILIKQTVSVPKIKWIIPEPHASINVIDYVIDAAQKELTNCKTDKENDDKMQRIANELLLYKKYELFDVLRVLIYIVNTFQNKNVVYGVGRGSSVSSYILYILGLHDVDSYKYDLDIADFLHD